ncbi:hypothetical protein K7X08_030041 [Anisodus acutangulus]|uniref:Anaphase-promoting complex subunit 4-like WD40 domain-containing protein n=1 Tax=Anisodus acutangulus TaxID=402998 RepID=A0A9Q1LNH1_9SOLA|nr:hypothetical protein K7X08_030041 [Anisodus acutangulus]
MSNKITTSGSGNNTSGNNGVIQQVNRPPLLNHKKYSQENLDRFIPNRSTMDFDYAHYMLSGGKVKKEHVGVNSASKEAYSKQLAEIFNMNRTRILAFKNKPPPSVERVAESPSPIQQSRTVKKRRYISQSPERTLDAPDILDDFYLNLLDWGSSNVIAIALGNFVFLWDTSNGSTTELLEVDDDFGPVTDVSWSPDGRHLAVTLNNSHVQLWDSQSSRLLRTLRGHRLRVGSLDWNGHILTTGGMDCMIINNDVCVRSHVVGTYKGHNQEICGLKWSASGQQLASGCNDNLVHIWSISMGFGTPNRACLNSVNTGSQVCSLLWNRHERELLSSHGFTDNQLTGWKYPSMMKISELFGHTSRVLHMVQSPDGYTVATAAADEMLRLWNVLGNPEEAKPVPKRKLEPVFDLAQIR